MRILITGGCGFIGSNLVRLLVQEKGSTVINIDKLTYAGNPASLADLEDHPNYHFEQIDLATACASKSDAQRTQHEEAVSPSAIHHSPFQKTLKEVFEKYRPHAVMHLAAESHVDRSIDGPGEFIQTNIVGTFNLLQASLAYWRSLRAEGKDEGRIKNREEKNSSSAICFPPSNGEAVAPFRFLHVSTDEVYGSLMSDAPGFSETTPYDPHSPYAASKAASDHLVRAWGDTYGLPVLVTNCSNNYGPYQFPEKLIPVVILKCLRGERIPVYGKGENIRDWLYVEDHAEALYTVLTKGRVGETYNIGGNIERQNIELVHTLCQLMNEFQPDYTPNSPLSTPIGHKNYEALITFVTDRPGHDFRYAIDASKIRDELGWEPKEDFESGLRKTVQWYLENREWWRLCRSRK